MGFIILDLDNTIADDGWRIPHIDWKQPDPTLKYHKYHSLAPFDECGNRHLFESQLAAVNNIVIFTARPVQHMLQTEEWLKRQGVNFAAMYMRNNNDHRPSADLKMAQLGWMLSDFEACVGDVFGAYDDRPEVIEAYQRAGIKYAQRVKIHDACAYTNPNKEK